MCVFVLLCVLAPSFKLYFTTHTVVDIPDSGDVVVKSAINPRLTVIADNILPRNPPEIVRIPNLIKHQFLHEASMLESLQARFDAEEIYTYSGPVIISVNPFKRLPIYSDEQVAKYKEIQEDDDSSPHVFHVAQRAFGKLIHEGQSQSIIITGESGAGKTEATKYMLRYLAAVATDDSDLMLGNTMNPMMRVQRVEQQVRFEHTGVLTDALLRLGTSFLHTYYHGSNTPNSGG